MLRGLTDGRRTIRRWLAARRLRRRFRETLQYTVGAMPEDTFGRLAAIAQPLDGVPPMTAPLSGRPCLYWIVEIVELVANDWPSRDLLREDRWVPFLLVEEGHTAVVDPASAEISLAFDFTSRSNAAYDATNEQKALLEAHGLVKRDWFNTDGLLYREAIIEVGERIWLLGSGTREPDPDPRSAAGAYRDGPATRLRLTSSAQHPLCITDDPRCV